MNPAGAPEELTFSFEVDDGDATEDDCVETAPEPHQEIDAGKQAPDEHDDADGIEFAADLKRRVERLRVVSQVTRTEPRRRIPISPPETIEVIDVTVTSAVWQEVADKPQDEILEDPDLSDNGSAPVDEALSIAQFYERLRRALQEEFAGEVWITGEIQGFRESRGHRYLELADHGVERVGRGVAQSLEVVCWSREWPPIARALADAGVDLEVGRVVRVRGKVFVWEGGSKLRFTLTALDVEALLGGIAAARRKLLTALAAEGLLEANKAFPVPLVPLRIGLITSPGSEAHRDFLGQLERSGYAFDVHLVPSLVQGNEAPNQIAAAFERLVEVEPDIAVLVRGGGARGDLAAFDAELVARAIAMAPFPVWTGIGHTGDRSVADEVSQRALITPTACGEAVVAEVARYFGETLQQMGVIARLAGARVDGAQHRLSTTVSTLVGTARHQLERRADALSVGRANLSRGSIACLAGEQQAIARNGQSLVSACHRHLASQEALMVRHRQLLRAFDPRRQLERGWTLTRDDDGRIVRDLGSIAVGQRLISRFADGEVTSVVESLPTLDSDKKDISNEPITNESPVVQ